MEQEMKYIYSVYKNGSFSKAAQELFITQPALSISVSKVEARIGIPLFDRTAKPVKLTEAGEYYIRKYHEIRNLEHELAEQLNDLTSLHTGSLRIGGTHYFNAHVLPPVLVSFAQKYPGISLHLVEAGADSLLQMLYDQDVDLTFNCTSKPKDSFLRKPCFVDNLLLSVPESMVPGNLSNSALDPCEITEKKHLESNCPAVSLQEFYMLPFITLTPGNDLHGRVHSMFEELGINPFVKMEVRQLVTAWQLSVAGMGATFIPDFLIRGDEKGILLFQCSSRLATRVFDLCMSDRHYISNAMSAFADVMGEYYNVSVEK